MQPDISWPRIQPFNHQYQLKNQNIFINKSFTLCGTSSINISILFVENVLITLPYNILGQTRLLCIFFNIYISFLLYILR